ncbi:glycosyltransferase family 4 protein [Robiginitalea aurantiaca]|uniref:Glycosyltransferase family 4 protein n=1 Tax=Robiginitalea aurantiaca TaxID=3056915 RepID=A0ABT7WDY2_9FLAO|nr:glycosyltransferase family 4 protein [Robiginitalea aurantiaca]MDM9631132.1 glycosyltransferase family 4 protein [Robiginitalea aurantiaca]
MKILFLTDNFPPEVNAPANRTFEHCREWVKEGVEVTVITGVPNFPKGRVFSGYSNRLYQEEYIEGIRVVRIWTIIAANEGFLKRILDYLSFAFMAFLSGLRIKTDLIIATSPQFFTAVAGHWLAFFRGKKWVMEVRDLWPESIVAVGAMNNGSTLRILEWLEKRLYQSADRIVVVTDTFKEKIVARGIDPGKVAVFKNGVSLINFRPRVKDEELVERLGLKGKFVVGYIGTLGMAHGLNFILNAIIELRTSHPELLFLFIGDGAEKQKLLLQAQKLGISNALFLDSVSKAEVHRYLSLQDVALVNLRKSETFKAVIPSKIFEAAAMEKPILLGLEGEAREIVEFFGAGVCYMPEDKMSFLNALEEIRRPEKYSKAKIGTNALSLKFGRKDIARKMLIFLKSI